MGFIRNKITNKISSLINKFRHSRKVAKMKKLNERIIKNKETDIKRWKHNDQLQENWNERTKIIADYIDRKSRIIEFGAGNMYLKDYLDPEHYTPTDIVKRFDETTVSDLNESIEIDLSEFDTAVFSGVLEYVHDVERVFKQLQNFKVQQVVLSYCCSDINTKSRSLNGWFSDLSKSEIETIFGENNYQIQDYIEWDEQSIFNLILKN